MQCWDKNECYREKEECEYIMNERVQEKRPKGVRVFERGTFVARNNGPFSHGSGEQSSTISNRFCPRITVYINNSHM